MSDALAVPLPDVNVLLALTHASHEFHRPARGWFAQSARFATTPITELGLVRLLVNPSVVGEKIPSAAALGTLKALRTHARATFWPDDTSLDDDPLTDVPFGHRQVTDLHLVRLAARHGGILVTFDRRLERSLDRDQKEHVRVIAV